MPLCMYHTGARALFDEPFASHGGMGINQTDGQTGMAIFISTVTLPW